MPIYEFRCQACDHVFDLLILGRGEVELKCPECQSWEIVKLMSPSSHTIGAATRPKKAGLTSRACGSNSCTTIDVPGRYD